jgi:hypothetical protein
MTVFLREGSSRAAWGGVARRLRGRMLPPNRAAGLRLASHDPHARTLSAARLSAAAACVRTCATKHPNSIGEFQ